LIAQSCLVSVVLPVRDGASFLRDALDSLAGQTHRPIELLIVDGASTDGSREIAAAFPTPPDMTLHIIDQTTRGGISEAWSMGMAAARGDLLAFIGADDLWLPGKLAAQIALLAERPDADMAITGLRYQAEPGYAGSGAPNTRLLGRDHVGMTFETLLVRRAVYERLGALDGRYGMSADSDWLARAKDAGFALVAVPDVLVIKRLHGGNLSDQAAAIQANLLRVVRATVRRQRGEEP
jgi:glycosyltransferase involved in cell wall biosynthesis